MEILFRLTSVHILFFSIFDSVVNVMTLGIHGMGVLFCFCFSWGGGLPFI